MVVKMLWLFIIKNGINFSQDNSITNENEQTVNGKPPGLT